MSSWYLFIPFCVGVSTILQGGLNRKASESWGLGQIIFLNAVVFLVISLVYYAFNRAILDSETGFLQRLSGFKWWFLVPGICGFIIVLGLPIGFEKLGAATMIVVLVATQICLGMLWDLVVEGQHIAWLRVVGATLAIMGAYMAAKG